LRFRPETCAAAPATAWRVGGGCGSRWSRGPVYERLSTAFPDRSGVALRLTTVYPKVFHRARFLAGASWSRRDGRLRRPSVAPARAGTSLERVVVHRREGRTPGPGEELTHSET